MINRVKEILTDKDWEASLIDGRLILKFVGEDVIYEFKRRTVSLKFLENLENLHRPVTFRLGEKEGDDPDYRQFQTDLDGPPSTTTP